MEISEAELPNLSAIELKGLIQQRKITSLDLTNLFLKRIEEVNPELNAFLYVNAEEARDYSKKVDSMVSQGDFSKPLLGIPVVIPDALNMKGAPTTFGSLLLKDSIAQEDAIEISLIKEAGAVILGKANVAEFGLSYITKNRLRPPSKHPLNPLYTPGGPNGGSAVALASGLAALAMATDIGGSLRLISSFCGLIGLMPTRGRVPNIRKHLLPFTEQMLYRRGAIAKNAHDLALMFQVLAMPDRRDHLCSPTQAEDFQQAIENKGKKLKIAWSPDLGFLSADQDVLACTDEAIKTIKSMGHDIETVDINLTEDVFSHFKHILAADHYALIMELLESRPQDQDLLTDYTKEWLKIGDKVTGVQYSLGYAFTGWLQEEIDHLFQKYDILLTPIAPVAPFSY